jgi:hypothetical protein
MKDTSATRVYYDEALIIVAQMLEGPDRWKTIEERFNRASPGLAFQKPDARGGAVQEAERAYYDALRRADEWLQEKINRSILFAWRYNKATGEIFQLPHHDPMGDFYTRMTDDLAGARLFFFDRKSFDSAVTGIAQPTSGIRKPPVINKGGRPPEYDWDAIKAFALEQIKKLGKPHKNNKRLPSKTQLIELIQVEWSARYDQHPSTTSIRSHLNHWLAEVDGN